MNLVTNRLVSERVSRLVRKLDAGKPPVQFDERGVETERRATAPLLDSTPVFPKHGVKLGFRFFLDLQPRIQQVAGPLSHLAPS